MRSLARWLNSRRNRRQVRTQVRWGLEYIHRKYGQDAALTAWRSREGRDWYAENAPTIVQHVRIDGLTREDMAAQVCHSLAHAKQRGG